jgi:L-malate glycosyltransferase
MLNFVHLLPIASIPTRGSHGHHAGSDGCSLSSQNFLSEGENSIAARPNAKTRASDSLEKTPSERIRLAFILDSIQDWNLGGTERQLVVLVRTLDPLLFEPTIFILQPSSAARAKDVGCNVIVIGTHGKPSRVGSFLKLRAALRKFRPHIVQTFFVDGIFYGVTTAWLNRVPVIVESRRNAGHWQKGYHTAALRALNHVVDYWQCNSRYVAAMLESKEGIPSDRISVLPNSIDLSRFSPPNPEERLLARRRLSLPEDSLVIVAVSTLRPVKGLPSLIEAAACLQSRLPKSLFIIVGEGPQRTALEEQIHREGLQDAVRLAGAQEDVRPWLVAADIGVLASQSESSSNALLEYMAMGLPVVVSDIPANHELVAGEFFPAGSATKLAEQLYLLLTNGPARQRLGLNNRALAIRHGEAAYSESAQSYYLKLAYRHLKNFHLEVQRDN